MDIRIRAAAASDREGLTHLVRAFRDEHSLLIGGQGRCTLDEAAQEVARYLGRDDAGYFVAVDPTGLPVGFRRWERRDGFYFTRELYIIPEVRRQGVARALIRHFERWLLENGQEIACISCTPHNVAMIALARAEGYGILNTIEMRKDLGASPRTPRGEREALGLAWKVL